MQIDEAIMWMGAPQLLVITPVPPIIKRIPPKRLCAFGFANFASRAFNPDFAGDQLNQIQILRAIGLPFVMVTLSLIATVSLRAEDAGSAGSLFNILRNLGGAIGIALIATLIDDRAKTYFDYLREALVPSNPQVAERLSFWADKLGSEQAALAKLGEMPHQQAAIMAYNDAFHFIGIALAISMPAVLLTRPLPAGATSGTSAAH